MDKIMNFRDYLEAAKYTDYSDPSNPWKDSWKQKEGEPKKLAPKFIVLGQDETFAFVWGDHNLMPWPQVMDKARQVLATSKWQKQDTDILLTPQGNIILDRSQDHTKWSGSKNLYTREIPRMVKELLKRRIIKKTAKIYVGNWAGQWGEMIGTAEQILQFQEYPDDLVLYHGTNNVRAEEILRDGLKAMPVQQRQWRGRADRGHPEYRDEAVYLTATPYQATTYTRRAVNVARRHGIKNTHQVILKIVLNKQDYGKLRADDDYLQKMDGKGDPMNWRESLSYFGQVAFVGSIAPSQISVYRDFKDEAGAKPSQGEENVE